MKILVINRGSSNLKCSLYEFKNLPFDVLPSSWEAQIDWRDEPSKRKLCVRNEKGETYTSIVVEATMELAIDHLFKNFLCSGPTGVINSLDEIDIIGHRIVHGGNFYRNSVFIDNKVKENIRSVSDLAPLHNPPALECMEILEKLVKNKPHIAVFDTSFHQTLPEEAAIYPVPYHWYEDNIRRYGFHGISYQYVFHKSGIILGRDLTNSKVIICHLGSGASLCAIQEGKSIDTTMGFTPMEGLMMDTRSGSIDPGIIFYLLEQKKQSASELYTILNQESGIWGLTKRCKNMCDILEYSKKGDEQASLALKVYLHRLNACIGGLIASLKGLDVLVFTGGVGENAAFIRSEVCANFSFLGLEVDKCQNEASENGDREISAPDSKIKGLVIYTKEAFEIARECWKKLNFS